MHEQLPIAFSCNVPVSHFPNLLLNSTPRRQRPCPTCTHVCCASPLVTGCCFQLLCGSRFAGSASCFSSAFIRLHQLVVVMSHRGTSNLMKHHVSEGGGHHASFSMKYVVLEVIFCGISERSIFLAFKGTFFHCCQACLLECIALLQQSKTNTSQQNYKKNAPLL